MRYHGSLRVDDSGAERWTLLDLIQRPAWHARAACRGQISHGVSDWFPNSSSQGREARAKQVCAKCPVRAECAKAGENETYGIWGGVNKERGRHGNAERAS